MKFLFASAFLFFTLQSSFAQTSCVDLANYDNTYLNAVTFDDVTYPVGSAFITSGYIQYVKPSTGNSYQFIQGDTLMYIGDIDIDVSSDPCSDHTLTFSCIFLNELSVDGTVIFNAGIPPATFAGNGWTFTSQGQTFQISGDFDGVSLSSSTNFLFDVCLECTTNSSECVDLANYDNTYLNAVTFDDVTYPVGSAFITSGYIQYVKPSTGNSYQFIQGDTLMYIGDIDIDVSSDPCSDHTLTFSCIFLNELSVDGTVVFNAGIPPATFAGNGWTFTSQGQNFQISGDFDVVSLSSSTNFLYNVCLDCTTNSSECVDLANYDNTYLNAVTFDDVTYPVGTAFITSGYIQYVKPSTGNFYQFIQGDSLMYIGDIDIDVSSDPCTDHTLTFSSIYLEGVSVEGAVVYTGLNPPASFIGNGWTFTYLGGTDYQVSGVFDVVNLFSSTNFLFDVCLECNTAGLEEVEANSLRVYPNPSNGVVYVELSGSSEISVYTLSGQLVERQRGSGTVLSFDLRPGSYIITSEDEYGMNMQQGIIVF